MYTHFLSGNDPLLLLHHICLFQYLSEIHAKFLFFQPLQLQSLNHFQGPLLLNEVLEFVLEVRHFLTLIFPYLFEILPPLFHGHLLVFSFLSQVDGLVLLILLFSDSINHFIKFVYQPNLDGHFSTLQFLLRAFRFISYEILKSFEL